MSCLAIKAASILGRATSLRKLSTAAEPAAQIGSALSYTAEERRFRSCARDFAETEIAKYVKDMDNAGELKKEVLSGLFSQGFLGVEIEKQYGGLGASFISSCLVVEEISKVDPGVAVMVDIQNTLNNTLIRALGTDKQKAKYLPMLCKDTVSSFCLSESSSGSDAFAMQSRAIKTDGGYILNGTKQWISNSAEANVFIVMANADPTKGFRGITTFLVDRNQPGVHVGKKENKLGIRCSSTCVLAFEDVKVADDHVLGQVGQGYKYAISMLNEGRIGIAAQLLGLAEGCLQYTRPYFTQAALSEANRAAVELVECEIEAARLLIYNAARKREAGQAFIQQAAMAKLYASQVAERTARACVQWAGSMGVTQDCPAEKYYRDSKIGPIYEGTSNILLNTIAKGLDKVYN